MDEIVSAIIITHNRSELVKKAIESVRRQTYSKIELIVIDDASDEEHKETLRIYVQEQPVIYVYIDKEETKGGNYARNRGVKEASGKYIAFLDDDDEWLPTKIEKQVEFLENNLEYSFVACGKQYEVDYGVEKFEDNVELLPDGDLSDYIMCNIPYTTSTIMLRRIILDQVGCFDEKLRYWQEYELEMRLAQVTRFGVVRENLVLYRIIQSDRNRLTNRTDGWYEAVKIIEKKHKRMIREKGIDICRARKKLIAEDGIKRADVAGTSKRRYLFMLFYLEPNMAMLIKSFLGVCRYRDISWVNKYLDYRGKV